MPSPAIAQVGTGGGGAFEVEEAFVDCVEDDVGSPDVATATLEASSRRRLSLAIRCISPGLHAAWEEASSGALSCSRVRLSFTSNGMIPSSGGTLMSALGSMSRSRSMRRSVSRRSRLLADGDADGAGACRSSEGVDGARLFFESFGAAVACCSTATERLCSSRTAICSVRRRSACLRSVACTTS